MIWNIEGFRRNKTNLHHFTITHCPDFIFLSEPNLYQCDLALNMNYFQGEYFAALNSEDLYDLELPLRKSKASGGTMILWKRCWDPFVSVVPVCSSSFLPVVFAPPNLPLSIHICVYLPTAGKEWEFVDNLSKLILCIEQLNDKHPEAIFYIRGDFNASSKNIARASLFNKFSADHKLSKVPIHHQTYHHFTGNGQSDSDLDQLLFSSNAAFPKIL